MTNWRELGEVPDSDDDNFDDDSQDELLEDPVVPTVEPALPADKPRESPDDADIWSVPDSSPERPSPRRISTGSRPLSKPSEPVLRPSTPTKKHVASTLPATAREGAAEDSVKPSGPLPMEEASFPEDDISASYLRIAVSPTPSSPLSSPPRSRSISPQSLRAISPLGFREVSPTRSASPGLARARPDAPAKSRTPVDDDVEESRQASMRLERSLRPRKPIQQHPYLLESAQYTTFMKSHGMKPVRMPVETDLSRKRAQEKDSQEQDFEAEESQRGSQDDLLQNTEESTPLLFDDEGDERDELAPSPSPPRTSPTGVGLRASSQPFDETHTPLTSFSDDEDLPSLERLLHGPANPRVRNLKRQSSQLLSARRKRQNRLPSSSQVSSPQRQLIPPPNIWDLSSSPPEFEAHHHEPSQLLGNTSPTQSRPRSPSASTSALPSSTRSRRVGTLTAPVPIDNGSGEGLTDSDSSTSSQSSASGSEVIRNNSRRIRGVLPASWLRLDQRTDKPVARKERKSPEPGSTQAPKRGVAFPKQATPGRPTGTQFPFEFDESDEEPRQEQEKTRVAKPASTAPPIVIYDDGDDPSDMEDDSIDHMMPGRKRRAGSPSVPRAKKQKTAFADRPRKPRQPRITEVLGRSKSTSSATHTKKSAIKSSRKGHSGSSAKASARKRAPTPPLLSILDVMEPKAPKFVKIAARAVKKRKNLGRASPSKKAISLATRGDNVDALSALHDWKTGRTRQKATISPRREVPKSRPALSEVPSNSLHQPSQSRSRPAPSFPRKLVRQGSIDAFVRISSGQPSKKPPPTPSTVKHSKRKSLHDRTPDCRPAQLETDEVRLVRRRLHAHDRTLDRFYKNHNVAPSLDGLSDYANSLYSSTPQPTRPREDLGIPTKQPLHKSKGKANAKSRFRKSRPPRQVDPEAPQFSRANDPLPYEALVIEEVEVHEPQLKDKLMGLGPYGTQYTHHFEIFPLDRGAFFHETTLIGRGYINKAADAGLSDRIRHQRSSISFALDGQTLRWGMWDENTSSELGILFDWVIEQICVETLSAESTGQMAIEAADFVLRYVLDALSVEDDDTEKALVSRILEVLSTFVARIESVDWSNGTEKLREMQLEVCTRFSVTAMAVHSMSQGPRSDAMLNIKVESVLKRTVSATIKGLLSCGTEDLRTLYGDLQRRSFLERGIRPDRWLANCWVVSMRLLESANIPRGSFWDVTHSIMCTPSVASGTDAQVFEGLWLDMFTLLPLGEIDNDGVLIHGLRKIAPLEGWALPQRLLKRVFQLYKSKCRQSPSFNEYCRALIARCHYLVQQWGWYRCTGIIGAIFDFFGSENLANLRNEEVYKSPRFIEELGGNASLSVEPEDRCFHIFIKVLALTIQRLKQLERHNDIKNLVARTLPNHNRKYMKEDTVHQRDLAALRNHHDLLCTLFWAAPPELRPALHLVEKLVAPGSAHKEACLINLHAWNQLARFVVSSDESGVAFRPFVVWNNNVFNQVLDQYLSAASDIEQQFRELSSEMREVSTTVRDEMIAKNRATAMDVLHSLLKASLDVLQHAASFEAATGVLNANQLQKVFTSLDLQSPEFDWSVLQVALDTVEYFVGRLDEVSEEQYSSGLTDKIDSQLIDDAVLLLNEKIAKDFFWMARIVISLPAKKAPRKQSQQAACVEKTVTLGGRIAARFVKDGLTQLSYYFSPGRYCLFLNLPKNLATMERKYLPLFVAVLIKNRVFGFKDIKTSMLDLWLLFITKPLRFLGYENYLADLLKRHGFDFMQRATVIAGVAPDYNCNVDMFACAMHHMRRKLREAELESDSTLRQQLRSDYQKGLEMAMNRMKEDLALLRPEPAVHAAYIDFVRQIISLIKSHGVNICKLDAFFTQPGPDYSPPVQDPQLHMAGIVAYGIRLGEQDLRAVPQFFHYLWNNFKIALGNERLQQERKILAKAMASEPHVLSFVLQYMVPAAILACERASNAWLLVEVYAGAVEDVLTGSCISRELMGSDIDHASGILMGVLAWFKSLRATERGRVTTTQVYIMKLLAAFVEAVRPSLRTYLYSEQGDGAAVVENAVETTRAFLLDAQAHVGEVLDLSDQGEMVEESIRLSALLGGLPLGGGGLGGGRDMKVTEFASVIFTDVNRTWAVSNERVTVQMAAGRMGTPSATQAGQGTRYGPWEGRALLRGWRTITGRWELGGTREEGRRGGREWGRRKGKGWARSPVVGDVMLF